MACATNARQYKGIFIMANAEIPPKSVKVLAVVNELGKAGTGNLLRQYQKNFPDDYMHLKLIIAHLDFLFQNGKIKKLVKYTNKWKGENPQIYQINDSGIFYLKRWKII